MNYQCPKFFNLSVPDRKNKVAQFKLCNNSLCIWALHHRWSLKSVGNVDNHITLCCTLNPPAVSDRRFPDKVLHQPMTVANFMSPPDLPPLIAQLVETILLKHLLPYHQMLE